MSGYLGSSVQHSELPSPKGFERNFGIISSSPYVKQEHIDLQESLYAHREKQGGKPDKMPGRYKHVAKIIQMQLQDLLTHAESFNNLKKNGVGFDKSAIDRLYWSTPKLDDRDPENPLEDLWIVNAEGLADDAQNIIDWARDVADGPVSVI